MCQFGPHMLSDHSIRRYTCISVKVHKSFTKISSLYDIREEENIAIMYII